MLKYLIHNFSHRRDNTKATKRLSINTTKERLFTLPKLFLCTMIIIIVNMKNKILVFEIGVKKPYGGGGYKA